MSLKEITPDLGLGLFLCAVQKTYLCKLATLKVNLIQNLLNYPSISAEVKSRESCPICRGLYWLIADADVDQPNILLKGIVYGICYYSFGFWSTKCRSASSPSCLACNRISFSFECDGKTTQKREKAKSYYYNGHACTGIEWIR
jgi:hypothetical protein